MVPYADMHNHRPGNATMWGYDDEENCFIVGALEPIKKGEEVFINYGKEISNRRMFFSYGFLQIPNDCDDVMIKLGINDDTPAYHMNIKEVKAVEYGEEK